MIVFFVENQLDSILIYMAALNIVIMFSRPYTMLIDQ